MGQGKPSSRSVCLNVVSVAKNGDFPQQTHKLPEGTTNLKYGKLRVYISDEKWPVSEP